MAKCRSLRRCRNQDNLQAKTQRVDVVGLIGQQVTYIRTCCPKKRATALRFIQRDDVDGVRNPAPLAVITFRKP